MATDDQVIRLILDLVGADKAEALGKKLTDLKVVTDAVAAAATKAESAEYDLSVTTNLLGRSVEHATQAEYALAHVDDDLARANAQVATSARAAGEAVESAATKAAAGAAKVAPAAAAAAGATKSYQQNVVGLSNVMNDFFGTSGNLGQRLTSIANNMPQLLAGFGNLGLGLAGILPIVALLITHWDKFSGLFGSSVDAMKSKADSLKEKIKELEAKPVKLSVDTLELDLAQKELARLEAAYSAFRAFQGLTTKTQKEAGSQAAEILADAPGGAEALAAKVKAAHVKDQTEKSDRLRDAQREQAEAEAERDAAAKELATGGGQDEFSAARLAKAEQRVKAAREMGSAVRDALKKAAEQFIGDVFKNATEGKEGGAEMMARVLEHSGFGETAAKMRGATPAGVTSAKDAAEEEKEQEQANEADQKESDRRLAKRAKDAAKAKQDAAKEKYGDFEDELSLHAGIKKYGKIEIVKPHKTPEQVARENIEGLTADRTLELTRQGMGRVDAHEQAQWEAQQDAARERRGNAGGFKSVPVSAPRPAGDGDQAAAAVGRTQELAGAAVAAIGMTSEQVLALAQRNAALERELNRVRRDVQMASNAVTSQTIGSV